MYRLHNLIISATALAAGGVLVWLVLTLVLESLPAIQLSSWRLLLSEAWLPERLEFGGQAFVFGSIATSLLALIGVIPLGLAVGVVSNSYVPICPAGVRHLVIGIVELTASLPSVAIGFWGITVLIPLLNPIQIWLNQNLGLIPFFGGSSPSGSSLLIASLVLLIMTLPVVASLTRIALEGLSPALHHSSMALGLTNWETLWQFCLPAIHRSLISSGILALGRALGETMAVTMVIGNPTRPKVNWSVVQPASTIPALLANQFPEALEPIHISALMSLALMLFAITFLTNLCAVAIARNPAK